MAGTQVRIEGGEGYMAGVDARVHCLQMIEVGHHEIHEGEFFTLTSVVDKDASETLEVRLLTPAAPAEIHIVGTLTGTGETLYEFFETTTKTHVGGNAITPLNRNRNSSNTSGITELCHTPGGSGDGNLIWTLQQGAGAFSAQHRATSEFILKYATAYLFRATSKANGNTISIEFDWYEESTPSHPIYHP